MLHKVQGEEVRELACRWPGFLGIGRCNETPPISRGHLRGDKKWEENEQTGIQESPAMTAVRVYFLGTRHGGEAATRRGKSTKCCATKSSTLTSCLPRSPVLLGQWLMSDLLPRSLEFTGMGLSSEHRLLIQRAAFPIMSAKCCQPSLGSLTLA